MNFKMFLTEVAVRGDQLFLVKIAEHDDDLRSYFDELYVCATDEDRVSIILREIKAHHWDEDLDEDQLEQLHQTKTTEDLLEILDDVRGQEHYSWVDLILCEDRKIAKPPPRLGDPEVK